MKFTIFQGSGTFSTRTGMPALSSSSLVTFPKLEYSESLQRLFQGKHVHLGAHDVDGSKFSAMGTLHHEICRNISQVTMPETLSGGFYARKSFPHRNIFNAKWV